MPDLLTLLSSPILAAETRQWTTIGDDSAPSYLSSTRRARALNLSRQLMASSGLYQRLMWAIVDEVVPPSIQLVYSGETLPKLQTQLDWIWKTGPSPLMVNARNLIATFFVEGELLLTPRINTQDGRVTLTNTNPDNIQSVIRGEGISTISQLGLIDSSSYKTSSFDVIRPDPTNTLAGTIFFFRLFPAGYTLGLRGAPLLMAILDDAASATELIYGRITRLSRAATHYWDVLLTGASQDTVDEFLSTNRATPPESGEVFAHNEQAVWKYVKGEVENLSPELLFVINYLAGASGLAPEFIGHTASRDVTTEALFSAITHLQALQADVVACLELILRFAAEQAAKAANINLDPKTDLIHITVREVGSRLVQRQAQAFLNFLSGLEKAMKSDLISKEQAAATTTLLLTRCGLVTPVQPTTRLAVVQ